MENLLLVWIAFGVAGLLLFIKQWPEWTAEDWIKAVLIFVVAWPLTWSLYFLAVALNKDNKKES